jgi:hypothetical protein
MIKIETDLEMLKAQVDTLVPNWRSRAARRTAKFIQQNGYEEKTSIWSEIKPIFMYLQNNRCAYCDRHIAEGDYSSGEFDLEHFRPKGRIEPYPTPDDGITYSFPTGNSQATGYYWLAYNLENYAVACITCNRALKADRFPIAGTRGTEASNVTELNQIELPLLLFPLRDDPEEYITFLGVAPQTVFNQGFQYQRAKVTIELFRLADADGRKDLHHGRSVVIGIMWAQSKISQISSEEDEKKIAIQIIEDLCDSKSRLGHSACAKAYRRLLHDDPILAKKMYVEAAEFVDREKLIRVSNQSTTSS